MNGSRVLGPAVGGVAIRFVGVAPIFYYNSLSFAAMIGALLLMHLPTMAAAGRHPWRDLREGLDYLRRTPSIVLILALVAAVATFVMNFSVLMPVIAHDTLHTGPTGLGWMWTAMGLGAVAGSMTVVAWSRAAVAGPMLLLVALVASASTAALAVTTAMPAALAMLLVVGWSTGAFFASANSAIQHRVTDRVRGRVLSVYSMIFAGTTPLGGLFVAAVASTGGVSLALAAAGGVSLAIGLMLALPVLRTLEVPPLPTAGAQVLDRPAS
jgi:predicted MFS family arabinose efflux permease